MAGLTLFPVHVPQCSGPARVNVSSFTLLPSCPGPVRTFWAPQHSARAYGGWLYGLGQPTRCHVGQTLGDLLKLGSGLGVPTSFRISQEVHDSNSIVTLSPCGYWALVPIVTVLEILSQGKFKSSVGHCQATSSILKLVTLRNWSWSWGAVSEGLGLVPSFHIVSLSHL